MKTKIIKDGNESIVVRITEDGDGVNYAFFTQEDCNEEEKLIYQTDIKFTYWRQNTLYCSICKQETRDDNKTVFIVTKAYDPSELFFSKKDSAVKYIEEEQFKLKRD